MCVSYGSTLLRLSAEPAHSTEAHERPQGKGAAPSVCVCVAVHLGAQVTGRLWALASALLDLDKAFPHAVVRASS